MAGRVHVTGASGFLGRAVVARLRSEGREVCGWSRRDAPGTSRIADYAALDPGPGDALVHLAEEPAVAAVAPAVAESQARTLEALLARRWSSVIYASSAAVYGDRDPHPHDEDETPRARSGYARAKLANEARVAAAGGTSLRFANLVGPGAAPGSVLGAILSQIGRAGPLVLRDTVTLRDFLCRADAARAVSLALDGPPGIYNIASGESLTTGDLARRVLALAGETREVRGETAPDPPSVLRLANTRAAAVLGWRPEIALDTCLAAMLETSA